MATTASLTTTPTQIDSGSSDNVSVTNTGATDVTVTRGSQSFTLRPTQGRVIYPEGTAVTVATVSGTGSVSYTATTARASAASQYAADPAFTGTYAPLTGASFRVGRKWLFSGTSITHGSGASNAIYAFPAQSVSMAGTFYASLGSLEGGTPGATVAGQLALLPARLANNPDAVFIEVGPNDSSDSNATALASFQASVAAMVTLARKAGAAIVITTPTTFGTATQTSATRARANAYAQWIRTWAPTVGARVADFHAALLDGTTGDMLATYDSGDHTHPNDLGHMRLAQVAADAIRPLATPVGTPLIGGPVVSAGLGLVTNPLMVANVTVPATSTSVTATGDAATRSIEADTTGRLPAGNWAKNVWTTVASAVTATRTMTVTGSWAIGDVVALSGYAEVTDAAARWEADVAAGTASARMFLRTNSVTNYATAWPRTAGRRLGSGVYAIGPAWLPVAIPVASTLLDITYSVTLPVGAAATIRFGCLDVINLTALGITPDTTSGLAPALVSV